MPESAEKKGYGQNTLATTLLVIFFTITVTPWLYFVVDEADLQKFKFNGFKFYRAVWLIPLYYAVSAAGAYLFFAGNMKLAAIFPLAMLGTVAGLDFGTLQLTPLRIGGFVGVTVVAAGIGLVASRRSTVYQYSSADDDTYLVPLREVNDSGGDAENSPMVTLDRDLSVLVLGQTGAGKTESIKLLAHQMKTAEENAFVVFDYKSDFREFLGDEEMIRLTIDGSTHNWNVFREAKREDDFDEIGRALFAGTDEENTDEFFETAAQQVFVGVLKYLDREFKKRGEEPTNQDLVEYMNMTDAATLEAAFEEHPDLQGLTSYVSTEASKQSLGVVATIRKTVNQIFTGDFAEDGEFSVREYIEDPQGRILVLDFPITKGESVKPAFRLFVDWSIRFGLADGDRGTNYILDEFQRLPELERIDDLINVGRAQQSQAILGLQSVAQLQDTYGEEKANALLSGLAQEILMRSGDQASLEYIRDQLGREQYERLDIDYDQDDDPRRAQTQIDERYPISERTITEFDPGEAIILTREGWIHGSIHLLSEVRDKIDAARDQS